MTHGRVSIIVPSRNEPALNTVGLSKKERRAIYQARYIQSHTDRVRERARLAAKKYREKYPERVRASNAKSLALNPERRKAVVQKHYWANVEAKREKSRRYHSLNRDAERAKARKHYAKNRERILARIREKKYGISIDQVQQMFDRQGGACKACGEQMTSTLALDHNHVTGVVRGLLCRNCNLAIGLVGDSVTRLRAMASYLELASSSEVERAS